jgi:RimJ/RimL family protein N-acetyltransferase
MAKGKPRWLINLYPPFLGAGIRVTRLQPDWKAIDVEMKLTFWNRNYVGTHFGGSLYAMTDPFYMLMLIQNLGRDYIVWDKAATIRFRKPGKGRMFAAFRLTDQQLDDLRTEVNAQGKIEPNFVVEVKDETGTVIAEVEKVLHIHKKRDINHALASPERPIALDARFASHGPDVPRDQLPKPAIRPYPLQYVSSWTMKDGHPVIIRPIRPEDEPLMVKFHETLSDRSVYLRYFYSFSLSRRVAHERLLRICFGDYDREMALVAELTDPASSERRIIAVGRMNKLDNKNEAEVAVLVSDQYQNLGLGNELLRRIVNIARTEKLSRLSAEMLPDNIGMQVVFKRQGFQISAGEDLTSLMAVFDL